MMGEQYNPRDDTSLDGPDVIGVVIILSAFALFWFSIGLYAGYKFS